MMLLPDWAFYFINPYSSMKKLQCTKGFTLVEIMIVVVIIVLLAAMAIPAFQKVRSGAQDKMVTDNLRLLGAAADQYFLENGVSTVALSVLVGTESSQYIRALQTVAQENYATQINQGAAITAFGVAGARTITYSN
jgi:type IV pilus assembly protein PilA